MHVFKYIKAPYQKPQEGWGGRPSSLPCKRSVNNRFQTLCQKILPSTAVSGFHSESKNPNPLPDIYTYMYVYIDLCMCNTHKHTPHMCFFFIHWAFCMDFLLSLPESWPDIWEHLHTDLSKLCTGLSKSTMGQSEFQNYIALSGFQEGKWETFFSFLDHREFWTFWESLWTSIKCDLFNVWICRRRGSQINWANVEMDLLPTPLQYNHISLSTSADNYWIRHSKRWLTNRYQANKDNLPFF